MNSPYTCTSRSSFSGVVVLGYPLIKTLVLATESALLTSDLNHLQEKDTAQIKHQKITYKNNSMYKT